MQTGWAEKPTTEAYENVFAAIFAALKKAQPQRDLQALANSAFIKVQHALLRLYRNFFRSQLLQSTYLTPVSVVSATAWVSPQRIRTQVADALGSALGKTTWIAS